VCESGDRGEEGDGAAREHGAHVRRGPFS
jgi:hypothetical protein